MRDRIGAKDLYQAPPDYWSSDFDESKNCQNESLVDQLSKLNSPEKCAVVVQDGGKDLGQKISNFQQN